MEPWQDPATVRRYEQQQRRRQRTTTTFNTDDNEMFDTSLLLSHFPWRIEFKESHNNDDDDDPKTQLDKSNNKLVNEGSTETIHQSNQSNNSTTIREAFPAWSYVDIRREQNRTFASQKLEQGAQLAKQHQQQQSQARNYDNFHKHIQTKDDSDDLLHSDHFDKAKQCYEDGLQMCPDYAPLWVALGALEANVGHYSKAETHLQHAILLDPTTPNAKEYLHAIQQQQQQRKVKKSPWVERSEMARQSVVLEQAMMMMTSPQQSDEPRLPHVDDDNGQMLFSDDDIKVKTIRTNREPPKYSNDNENKDDDHDEKNGRDRQKEHRSRRRRRRRHDEEGESHKKHHKRHKSHIDPEIDSEDNDNASEDESRRRRRRHHRRRRRSEEQNESADTDEDDDSDESRQRRRHRRRKRRRKRYDQERHYTRKRRNDENDEDHAYANHHFDGKDPLNHVDHRDGALSPSLANLQKVVF